MPEPLITDLPMSAGPAGLEVLPRLERALAGQGPVRPHDPSVTPQPLPRHDGELPSDLAVVVGTSGSTGTPKLAMLGAQALAASAAATHDRLGGPGQWLLALPPHHVAGLQVLLRSIHAGTRPVVTDPSLTPFALVQAVAAMDGERRYASLVPAQLGQMVEDPMGLEALSRLDAVLVGGAATPPPVAQRARDAGVRIVLTYGMSETCGGCVYDGRALSGLDVRVSDRGTLELGGPCVAYGYLGEPELTAEYFVTDAGARWFRTDDVGSVDERGKVSVTGRADDLINSGGLKVAPRLVEEAALAHVPAITGAIAVGVPHERWGEGVALLVTTSPGGPPVGSVPEGGVAQIREMLRAHLPAHALPQVVRVTSKLPTLGPGKPDRRAAAQVLG
ncbi:o-succinylbenzoate--CoA ligase [Marihabitans asiaticum]|uniref:O-succinylbenzoic acid--CoA ligase n=1 Tax=Marihabitans asiaticum TaxID=415218 RepID=A0A560WHK6_9MICO|nr:o-succinylbenzoate--CoA ligase [Marihabitans asiaticum]TWD17119.1 O-succinylbenzoic acid--CoA ligase [Marihabitans asiaticum]